ncbi:hypothetical protein ILUMI_18871, partial [Ignelater luminosus]
MNVNKTIILLFVFLWENVLSANILHVTPIASPSHHIWNKAFALALVKKGHNVTMLTNEKENKLPENFTVITME